MRNFWKSVGSVEKGFTLIELLVAICILAVLAAIVVPNVGRFLGEGDTEAMATELHNVQLAMNAGMADNGITEVSSQ